jgi:GxxExxY protein
MNEERDKLTQTIIGCAFKVSNTLGCGFLEKVYENALAIEMTISGLKGDQKKPIPVIYRGTPLAIMLQTF